MRRKIVLLDYNKEVILEKLNNFSNVIDNNKVVTKYNNKILSIVDISNRYFNFNFSEFVKNIIDKLDNYFEPIKYTFHITKSFQELKLYSHAVELNGELYYKTLSILNSTDKSYALQINIGLVHSKTYASFYIKEANEYVSIRNKHFKASLPDTIEYFFQAIENLNLVFDDQIKYFQKISNKNISLLQFVNEYLKKDDDIVVASDLLKLRALTHLILNNTYNLNIAAEQINTIKTINSNIDVFRNLLSNNHFFIESNILYNLYMMVFKNYNTSVCIRESDKFINIINKL